VCSHAAKDNLKRAEAEIFSLQRQLGASKYTWYPSCLRSLSACCAHPLGFTVPRGSVLDASLLNMQPAISERRRVRR